MLHRRASRLPPLAHVASHRPNPAPPQKQEQAEAYVATVAASPDCWRLCIERYGSTAHLEVRFWALQKLHEVR